MLALSSYGIPPGDALKLLVYNEELEYFVDQYSRIQKRLRIQEQLQTVENYRRAIISTSGKKGETSYKKWRLDQLDLLEATLKVEEKPTVFQKAFDYVSKGARTMFERMRGE